MENMTNILAKLTETLQLTSAGSKIVSITPMTVPIRDTGYVKDVARVTYSNGHIRDVDIDCDSGIAAIFDVAKALTY